MELAVIYFISFCLAFGTPTETESDPVAAESTHVKSIRIPYRSPVHFTGYYPATTILEAPILKSHSYATEVRHLVPAVGAAPAVIKAATAIAAGPLKSSLVQHEVPVVGALHGAVTAENVPVVPVEVAPVVVPAEGPVKSIKAFSFATEVKHEVPVAAEVPVVPVIAEPAVKSIHAPVVVPEVSVQPLVPAPVVAPVAAVGPVKSSGIKAFSFATEVKHEVPVAAVPAPVVAAPVAEAHVKSIHAPVLAAPAAGAHVKSIHAPLVAAPAAGAHVKSIHDQAIATHVVAPAPAVAPIAAAPVIVHADAPVVKSSAIKAFSYATEVKHEVPVAAVPAAVQVPVVVAPVAEAHVKSIHAPVVAAPAVQAHVKSIHAPVVAVPAVQAHAKSIHAPVVAVPAVQAHVKSIHAPVIASNHITAVKPVVQTTIVEPVARPIHAPVVGANLLAPAVRDPTSHSYITKLRHRTPTFGVHAPALSAAGLLGASYSHAGGHLLRRLPISASVNHGPYGRYYGYYPRLYASLAAPGATVWGGHPISSGVTYLGGISRGAFGYHAVPVHYQHHSSPVLGVWNHFRG